MDINGDGIDDILSGCYSDRGHAEMVGAFWVIAGKGDGKFSAPELLMGTDGKLLAVHETFEDRGAQLTENICTRPFACDWDGDGDLDILSGNFKGTFFLFMGEGKGQFAPEARQLVSVDGTPFKTAGVHSDPFVVDWDGDGDLDLVASSHTGEIVWAENLGPVDGDEASTIDSSPRLAAFERLIGPAGQTMRPLNGNAVTKPADYDAGITAAYELLDAEDFDGAEAAFMKVIESAPTIADGYYHMACCYARRAATAEGDARESGLDKAMALITAAVKFGWVNTRHMAADPDMELLRERDDYKGMIEAIDSIEKPKPVGPAGSTRMWITDFDGDGDLDILVGDKVTLESGAAGQVWLFLQK